MNVQCCRCKRVRVGGKWTADTHCLAGPFTHTYCPDCADELRIELFSSQASRSPQDDAQRVQDLLHDLRAAG